MANKKGQQSLADRTPLTEWVAASLGLVLTLAVVGYTVWEALIRDDGQPRLGIEAQPAIVTPSGYLVPIIVTNASPATAAEVVVAGRLQGPGRFEERRVRFAYVPGRGQVRGGLVFQAEPEPGAVAYVIEGFVEP